jgi:zinc dependent phospholipase C
MYARRRAATIAFLVAAVAMASPVHAYSVLAHEAIVDAEWEQGIRPLLIRRFPRTSVGELLNARGYAYGGSVIQDLGYYPFGNHFFSNVLHYVRSGDFVERLLRDATDVNEYAFALGALAHYAADNTGHPDAINRAVPLIFPKLRQKFGDRVLYVQAPKEHVIVEFSFDVVHAAAGRYGPEAYLKFIGFQVATPLLERAFREEYGVAVKDIFTDFDTAIGTYRFSVSQMIPALTEAAWKEKHEEIARLLPGVERSAFVFTYSPAQYEQAYGTHYQRPGWFARFLAFLYRLVPKVGPLKPLSFAVPTKSAETMFDASLVTARERYRAAISAEAAGHLDLRNTDFDTGQPTRHGEYALADDTYAELTERLATQGFDTAPPTMRRDIVAFYEHARLPSGSGDRERKHWDELQKALTVLAQVH